MAEEPDQNIQVLLDASQEFGNVESRNIDENIKLRVVEGTVRIGSNSRWFEVLVEDISGKPSTVTDVVAIEFLVSPQTRFNPKTDQKIGGIYRKNQWNAEPMSHCDSCVVTNVEFRIPKDSCPVKSCPVTGAYCTKHLPKQISSFHGKIACVRKHIQGGELYIAILTTTSYVVSSQINAKSSWVASMKRKRPEGEEGVEKMERFQAENIALRAELNACQQEAHNLRMENKKLAFFVHCATDGTSSVQHLTKELLTLSEGISSILNNKEWKGFWESLELRKDLPDQFPELGK